MVEFVAEVPPIDNDQNTSEESASGPFEGPEKLLEIWFAPAPVNVGDDDISHNNAGGRIGLRTVPRAVWEDMLGIVKCKVLSVVAGHEVDAYLLRSVQPKSLSTLFFSLNIVIAVSWIYALTLLPHVGLLGLPSFFHPTLKSTIPLHSLIHAANHHSSSSRINSFSKHAERRLIFWVYPEYLLLPVHTVVLTTCGDASTRGRVSCSPNDKLAHIVNGAMRSST